MIIKHISNLNRKLFPVSGGSKLYEILNICNFCDSL